MGEQQAPDPILPADRLAANRAIRWYVRVFPVWLLGTAALDLVLVGSASNRFYYRFDWVLAPLLGALACSQSGLAAIWLALGETRLVFRCLATVGLVGSWLYLLSFLGRSLPEFAVMVLGTQISITILGLMTFRYMGLRLEFVTEATSRRRGLQFSIRDMILLTTTIAFLLWLFQIIGAPRSDAIPAILAGTGSAVLVITAVWATLGNCPLRRFFALVVVAATVGYLGDWHLDVHPFLATQWCILQAFLLAASLAVFRWGGFRATMPGR